MKKCDVCNSEIKVGADFYDLTKWHYKTDKYHRPKHPGLHPLLAFPKEPETIYVCVNCRKILRRPRMEFFRLPIKKKKFNFSRI